MANMTCLYCDRTAAHWHRTRSAYVCRYHLCPACRGTGEATVVGGIGLLPHRRTCPCGSDAKVTDQ